MYHLRQEGRVSGFSTIRETMVLLIVGLPTGDLVGDPYQKRQIKDPDRSIWVRGRPPFVYFLTGTLSALFRGYKIPYMVFEAHITITLFRCLLFLCLRLHPLPEATLPFSVLFTINCLLTVGTIL